MPTCPITLSSVNAGALPTAHDAAVVAEPPPESLHDDDLDLAIRTDLYPVKSPLPPKAAEAMLTRGSRCRKTDSGRRSGERRINNATLKNASNKTQDTSPMGFH